MKEITTPTIAPSFKNKDLVLEPIITETKTTQGDSFFEYILKQPITIQYAYSEKEYKEYDKLPVKKDKEGFYMLDGYRCHVIEGYTLNGKKEKTNYLPVELFEEKLYAIVREYKSTVWEIK